MKNVFEKAFNKGENYQQIISAIKGSWVETRKSSQSKLPKYALMAGATVGVATVAYLLGKKIVGNKSLKLELN